MQEETTNLPKDGECTEVESVDSPPLGDHELLEKIKLLDEDLKEKCAKIEKLKRYIENVEDDGDRLSNELIIANSYKDCFNKITSPLIMVDASMNINYANNAFFEMTGTGPEIVEARVKCSDILNCHVYRKKCLLKECFENGDSVSGDEHDFVSSCGRRFKVTVDAFPIKNLATNEVLGGIEFYRKVVEDTTRQFLMFSLAGQEFGIDIKNLIEIVSDAKVIPVPKMPDFMYGVIRLRDGIIPAMNLAKRLELPGTLASNQRSSVILKVVSGDNKTVLGLGVDQVNEIVTLTAEDIEQMPQLSDGFLPNCVLGISKKDGKARVLIDCDLLYSLDEKTQLEISIP